MNNGFSERLKQLRKQRDLSQAQLAKAVGVHQNHIGRYERGESQPSADALRRLAEALTVTTDYLIEGMSDEGANSRFEDRELLRQFQEVERLPSADKLLVKSFLDALLFKRKVEEMAALGLSR
jgi:transcriptional regulator with XRE-family HTH domain